MNKLEVETVIEEVRKCLRDGLTRQIGRPLDKEKLKIELEALLKQMQEGAGLPVEMQKYNAVATELLSATFLGMPEGFDPHKMLRELPTSLLVLLREGYGESRGFPLNVIWLEILYRQDDLITDWSFKRITSTEAKLEFTLKKPLDYIALNLTVTEEKTH